VITTPSAVAASASRRCRPGGEFTATATRQRAVARRSAAFRRLDDTVMDRRIQDLWMLLSGDVKNARVRSQTARGLRNVPAIRPAELALIESLRHAADHAHAAWIARRWHDSAFKLGFPAFGSMRYWSEHVLHLREQLSDFDEPPLAP